MNLAVIDIIFIALIVIFTVRCALRGLISEVLSMAALVLGLLAALFFCGNGGEWIRLRFMPGTQTIPEVLAFIALFLIVFLAIKLVESMLKGIIEGVMLGSADRFFGILFGLLEGIIVVSLILFVLYIQPLFDPHPLLENSVFARLLMPIITGKGKDFAESIINSTVLLRITAGSAASV
ncbi:MAG: CvpA family protein [Treponema sp.]|nr:CvpA family protein [Treponema sp.]